MGTLRKLVKYFFETSYWSWRRIREGRLGNRHYEFLYTTHFDLDKSFYAGKRILDIGCGPRGSLEWADVAAERVGLDPLVPVYRRLGIGKHRMQYLAGVSESVPFPDAYFNIVCSINSLDHVHNLDETTSEIVRVLAPEGLFLLLTDVHSEATFCEPTAFSWDVVEQFLPQLELLESDHREKAFSSMGRNLREAPPFDHNNHENRHGILSAKFQKPGPRQGPQLR